MYIHGIIHIYVHVQYSIMDKAESQRITNVFDLYQEMLELLETAKNELDNTGEEQIKNMIDKVRHILLNF